MKRRVFFVFVVCLTVIFLAGFVKSITPPTDLRFYYNASSTHDEGTFSVNWTSISDNFNYSIYLSTNGGSSYIAKYYNTSNLGFAYSTTTEGSYTFKVGANTGIGNETNQSQTVTIAVDRTPPSVSFPVYNNATAKSNTSTFTLAALVSDPAGTNGKDCIINLNGASNQTVTVSSGWCNISSISLAGLSEGYKFFNIYTNDTVGNPGLNNVYAIQIDSISPSANATCSPSTVSAGDSFPCSCNGVDATSGVDSATGSSTSGSNTSTSTAGNFTYTCSVFDLAGNSANATSTYVVTSSGGTDNQTDDETDTETGSGTDTTSQTSSDTTTEDSGNLLTNLFGGGSNDEPETTSETETQEQPRATFFWSIVTLILISIVLISSILVKLVKKRNEVEN